LNGAALRESSAHWCRRLAAPFLLASYVLTGLAFALWTPIGWGPSSGLVRVLTEGLAGYFIALTCIGLQTLAGASLLALIGWDRALDSTAEKILFGWVVGFVLSSGILLGLAWVGVLNTWTVASTALVAGVWSSWRSRESFATAMQRWQGSGSGAIAGRNDADVGLAGLAIVLGFSVAILFWCWPLLAQTFLPNSDWDSALADPLFSAHSFPGAISLVYAAFMSLGMEAAIIPYNFLGVGLALLAAGCLAGRLGGGRVAGWTLLLCATAHVLWQLGVDPRVDAFLSIFVAAAVLGLCIWLEDREEPSALFLMALSINAAIGSKYTGLFIGLAIAGVALLLIAAEQIRGRRPWGVEKLALIAVLLVLPNGIWYASNAALHGDPLFPMLRGDYYESPERPGERIPTGAALEPALARLAPDSVERRRSLSLRQRFESKEPDNLFNLYDLLQRPDAYAVKSNHFASPLLFLFLALPFALPREPRRRAGCWCIYSIGLGCYVALASQTNLLRYVLPLLPLFAVGAAIVIAHFRSRLWHALILFFALGLLATHHVAEVEKLARLQPGIYLENDAKRIPWLKQAGYNQTTSMPIVIERINAEIAAGRMSAEDVILMVGEGKGRLLDCHYLPDLSWFMQRWVVELVLADHRPEEVLRSLRAQGVSHILYNKSYFVWVLSHTATPVDNIAYAMVQLERFLREHSELVIEAGGMGLFRLDSAPHAPHAPSAPPAPPANPPATRPPL